ncbi:MAG: UDP-N-acetylmuramate dehydrogenase [Betaproteobacteria bacterium]|nr:UDP-N-acetylmuramate dehydrogenase [Betaproteobacteria bacterium]
MDARPQHDRGFGIGLAREILRVSGSGLARDIGGRNGGPARARRGAPNGQRCCGRPSVIRQAPVALRGRLSVHEPMARHVTWRAGGAAARAYFPADLQDLAAFLGRLRADEPLLFVGLGSNLLVRDGGFDGTVVFTHGALSVLRLEDDGLIYAEAGVASPKVARFAANHGLGGAEFLAGIPGTVGGALAMNAGCHGGETWGIVAGVLTLDRFGRLRERAPADFGIGYRHCGLRDATDERFAAAWLRLSPRDGEAARRCIKDLLERRIATQPLQLPNAGSVFRNPPGDHAARLIEAAGLKGLWVGGAQVSEKHANFIVNPGATASAADIEALIARVQATVRERFGMELVREVRIVGEAAGAAVPCPEGERS